MKSLEEFYDDTALVWADKWYDNNMFIPTFKDLLLICLNNQKY